MKPTMRALGEIPAPRRTAISPPFQKVLWAVRKTARTARRVRRQWLDAFRVDDDAEVSLFGPYGVMTSTAGISREEKVKRAIYWQYRERAKVALAVAGNYYGGDYVEFGSDGMGTFRNFLSAYDLNGIDERFPDTRFLAFDIFGQLGSRELMKDEQAYFPHWKGDNKEQNAHSWLEHHGLYVDRCKIISGYFQDTVPEAIERYLHPNGRKIGFAFLDCNITRSYEFLFPHLLDAVNQFGFIYMDEYHSSHGRLRNPDQLRRPCSRWCHGPP